MAKSNVGKKPISEEEYTTNKVLTVFSVCLLGVLVLMILQRLLNYGSTFMIGLIVTKILLAIGIIGVVGGLVMLGMERTGRRNGSRRIICGRNLLIASVVMTVCMSAISYIGIAPIKALYVILPVLAVFYLVYHSYSTEFFVITVDCGAALGMMWLVHRALVSSNFTWMAYAVLIAAAVLTVAQIAVVHSVRGRQGKAKNTGKKAEARFSSNAFLMMTVTPILMGGADRSRPARSDAYDRRDGCGSGIPVRDRGLLHGQADVIYLFAGCGGWLTQSSAVLLLRRREHGCAGQSGRCCCVCSR